MAAYVYIDVSQKQEFIYKTSRLKDNLYNSFIIKAVTERLTKGDRNFDEEDTILKNIEVINLQGYLEQRFNDCHKFEYWGGGNSIIWFDTDDNAKSFIEGYSFEVLKAFPDLELYISFMCNEEVEDLKADERLIRDCLRDKLDKQKEERQGQFRRWTYGIEKIDESGKAKCIKTDDLLHYDKNNNVKQEAVRVARKYMLNKFERKLNDPYIKLTIELDDYKKHGDGKSYIGVISIDGNKMGEMVQQVKDFCELRSFSEKIDDIYFNAIVEAVNKRVGVINREDEKRELLITPILQAGDDICLILEAENAIEIAKDIIKHIKEASLKSENALITEYIKNDKVNYLTACGGVAIARQSYPFFELVKVSDRLCHEAKEAIYSINTEGEKENQNGSFINWEIVQSQVATEYDYSDYVKNRNIKEDYHIKPLRIDQYTSLQEGIFSYKSFKSMIRSIMDNKNISSSLLEGLKKHMYSGIEQYELYLDTNRENNSEMIENISSIFNGNTDKYMTYRTNDKKHIIYVLNDVLEVLPFMTILEDENNE